MSIKGYAVARYKKATHRGYIRQDWPRVRCEPGGSDVTIQDTPQHEGGSAYRPLELVKVLGLGRSTVYKLLRAGTIRSVKAGRRTVVPADAVRDFLKGRQ